MAVVLLTFMNTPVRFIFVKALLLKRQKYYICETFVDLLFPSLNEKLEEYDLSLYMVRRIDPM